MNKPVCIWQAGAALGEGPLWSEREQALYWVDILNSRLHRHSLRGGQHSWQIPRGVSAVAECEGDGLIITQRHGFARFDPVTGLVTPLVQVETDLPGNRFNDGKCDARGRFWAGTMDFHCKQETGSLYRLDPDLSWHRIDSGYAVTNGPAWSADWRTLYHNDSVNGRMFAFDYDVDTGAVSNKRLFRQFDKQDGSPDGMTVDAEGGLWVAHWGASKLSRFDAAGRVTMTVEMPCSQVTSCAFGGPGLRTLFITCAADGLTPEQQQREPLAGGLFAIEMDIAGMPAQMFKG